jgi:hypothetical protein
MGDESWFCHFDPETKRQSMEWHHKILPTEKPTAMPYACKTIGTLFWMLRDAYWLSFATEGNHQWCLLPSGAPEALLCTV